MFKKAIQISVALAAFFFIIGAICKPDGGTGYIPEGGGCLPGGNECVYAKI